MGGLRTSNESKPIACVWLCAAEGTTSRTTRTHHDSVNKCTRERHAEIHVSIRFAEGWEMQVANAVAAASIDSSRHGCNASTVVASAASDAWSAPPVHTHGKCGLTVAMRAPKCYEPELARVAKQSRTPMKRSCSVASCVKSCACPVSLQATSHRLASAH